MTLLKGGAYMLRIAVVEDDSAAAEILLRYIAKYQEEYHDLLEVDRFKDGAAFLDNYRLGYDIILMDIEMPNMDGMKTAQKMRRIDNNACLIFVTNMAQYAVKGYEVDAMDFLVKPVSYSIFKFKLKKAVSLVEKNKARGQGLILKTKNGMIRTQTSNVYFVESKQHRIFYHTAQDIIEVWGTLAQAEQELRPYGFSRCNSCYLVNLRYVDKIENNWVFLRDTQLEISRGKKKGFMEELMTFLGG